jgi:hypothetical protein
MLQGMQLAATTRPDSTVRITKIIFWSCVWAVPGYWLLPTCIEKCALFLAPTSKVGYYLKYSNPIMPSDPWEVATYDQVIIASQPHDCEWSAAPLGAKNCHYDPVVQTVRTYVNSRGEHYVSHDGGKTERFNSLDEKPSVYVSWVKVKE